MVAPVFVCANPDSIEHLCCRYLMTTGGAGRLRNVQRLLLVTVQRSLSPAHIMPPTGGLICGYQSALRQKHAPAGRGRARFPDALSGASAVRPRRPHQLPGPENQTSPEPFL